MSEKYSQATGVSLRFPGFSSVTMPRAAVSSERHTPQEGCSSSGAAPKHTKTRVAKRSGS